MTNQLRTALHLSLPLLLAGTAPYDVSGAHSAASGDPVWAQVVAGPFQALRELKDGDRVATR